MSYGLQPRAHNHSCWPCTLNGIGHLNHPADLGLGLDLYDYDAIKTAVVSHLFIHWALNLRMHKRRNAAKHFWYR